MTHPREIRDLIKKMEPALARAFMESIRDITDSVKISLLIDAIAKQDIDLVLRLLSISPADFSALSLAQIDAFNQAGAIYISKVKIPDTRLRFRWDARNHLAASAAERLSSNMITREVETSKQAVRQLLGRSFEEGRGPRDIALDIVGRKVAGKRKGGVVGLNAPQEEWRDSYRRKLNELSADYKSNSLRNRRYDKTIDKAIREGNPLSKDFIERATSDYSDRLLKYRGDTIARTEMSFAVESANAASFGQAAEQSGVPSQFQRRRWRHGGGGLNPRHGHEALNDQVRYGNEPFESVVNGSTAYMMHAHDPDAGAAHNVSCTCTTLYEVDYAGYYKWLNG